jgi:hypothetical protein
MACLCASAVTVLLGWLAWLSVLGMDVRTAGTVFRIHAVATPVALGLSLVLVYGLFPLPFRAIAPIPVRWRDLVAGIVVWGVLAAGSLGIGKYAYSHHPLPTQDRPSGTAVQRHDGRPAILRRDGTVVRYLSEEEYRALVSTERLDFSTVAVIITLLVIPVAGVRLFRPLR